MKDAFMKIKYKPPCHNQKVKTMLDDSYLDIKNKVDTILKKSFLLNIISNQNDNVKGKQIFNMTVLIKNCYTFDAFSKFV